MKKTFCSFSQLDKCSELHHFNDFTFINFANHRHESNLVNLSYRCIYFFSIRSRNFYMSYFSFFLYRDYSICIFLHLLNNLTTRPDYRTDEIFRDFHHHKFWSVWFHICIWLIYSFQHFTQNMHSTVSRLH